MKKTTLTLAIATALFTSLALLNCSKKEEPAPAPATTSAGSSTSGTTTNGTTSGTTTAGTTTSGNTTTGTTTNGSTTSGTTTSGTTSSGTTTSGSTTSGITYGGSGSFVVDGTSQTATTFMYMPGSSELKMTTINAQNDKYSFQIRISTESLQNGTYAIGNGALAFSGGGAGVAILPLGVVGVQYWSVAGGNVVVSGKKITISSVNLTQYNDATKKMTASCDITIN